MSVSNWRIRIYLLTYTNVCVPIQIDVFVMISCPEVELTDRKDYFQTLVSAMELELALNDNHQWMGKFVADFSEFLPGQVPSSAVVSVSLAMVIMRIF